MNCSCTCICVLCAVTCERDGTEEKQRNMSKTQRFATVIKNRKRMCYDKVRAKRCRFIASGSEHSTLLESQINPDSLNTSVVSLLRYVISPEISSLNHSEIVFFHRIFLASKQVRLK